MKRRIIRYFAAVVAAFVFVGIFPVMPVIYAETDNTPSVTAYATKSKLMKSFQQDGKNSTIGKLAFGKNANGNQLEWYILGKDNGVDGSNISIFAAAPITIGQMFESNRSVVKDYEETYGDYTNNPKKVNPNHYGASDLRQALKKIATNKSFFSKKERALMQATTITTYDALNDVNYTTSDILYALKGDDSGDTRLFAGSKNDKVLSRSVYWRDGVEFWLRSPNIYTSESAFFTDPAYKLIRSVNVDLTSAVRPATNLDISSVLFASAAKAASTSKTSKGTIAKGTAMVLRLDGSKKAIGEVVYDSKQGTLYVQKSPSAKETVSFVVQGNDGKNDWYYSKTITEGKRIYASNIKKSLKLTSDIDLSECKIWVEKTVDGVTYAKKAITSESNVKVSDNGNAKYKLTVSGLKNKTAIYMAPTNKSKTTVTIPSTVKINNITYKVTAIEKNAFKNNKKLKTLTIGTNVKSIGEKAFYGCSNLKTLTIKTTKLTTSSVKSQAFKSTSKNLTVKIPKKKFESYKSMLIKRGVSKKAKFKKYS